MSIEAIKESLASMCRTASMHDSAWTHRMGEVNDWGTQCWAIDGERVQELATAYGETTAAFIAACNPVAIRELIERLEAAEKDAARLGWLTKQFRAMSLDMGGNHCWVLARSGSIRGPNMIAAIDSAMAGGLAEGVSDA